MLQEEEEEDEEALVSGCESSNPKPGGRKSGDEQTNFAATNGLENTTTSFFPELLLPALDLWDLNGLELLSFLPRLAAILSSSERVLESSERWKDSRTSQADSLGGLQTLAAEWKLLTRVAEQMDGKFTWQPINRLDWIGFR